ncbi:MFS transporter small subunit [Microlunatus soli]|uniref:Uncharacterized protein n=1 Tax=Microlunatus soli TaxID=630515 RepID=A0A1H2AGJ3_9ACTN|nr:hypothetical protein [Microlunatus soli]SDT45081.1 hypothetical protein SAMN04489812_5920 [Microlunatus soli]
MNEDHGSGAGARTEGKYKLELVITWAIVGIPLLYGIVNAIKAVVQLFTG